MVENLLAAHSTSPLDTLYVTGGGSELPPVARILRENFGRKVRRSAYMRSASAIGLAIRAAVAIGSISARSVQPQLRHLARNRPRRDDHLRPDLSPRIAICPRPVSLPLRSERVYQPAHNIGHFRYLESLSSTSTGTRKAKSPTGISSVSPSIPSCSTTRILIPFR